MNNRCDSESNSGATALRHSAFIESYGEERRGSTCHHRAQTGFRTDSKPAPVISGKLTESGGANGRSLHGELGREGGLIKEAGRDDQSTLHPKHNTYSAPVALHGAPHTPAWSPEPGARSPGPGVRSIETHARTSSQYVLLLSVVRDRTRLRSGAKKSLVDCEG